MFASNATISTNDSDHDGGDGASTCVSGYTDNSGSLILSDEGANDDEEERDWLGAELGEMLGGPVIRTPSSLSRQSRSFTSNINNWIFPRPVSSSTATTSASAEEQELSTTVGRTLNNATDVRDIAALNIVEEPVLLMDTGPVVSVRPNRVKEVENKKRKNKKKDCGAWCCCFGICLFILIIILGLILLLFLKRRIFIFEKDGGDHRNGTNSMNGNKGSHIDSGSRGEDNIMDNNPATLAPTKLKPVLYGDIAYFELMFESSSNIVDSSSNLWLSGGRGVDETSVVVGDIFNLSVIERRWQPNIVVGLKHYEWVMRDAISENSVDEYECVKYGDRIYLQVNHSMVQNTWMGFGSSTHGFSDEVVETHDATSESESSWASYQYRWIIHSDHAVDLVSNDVPGGAAAAASATTTRATQIHDPKYKQCVQYDDVLNIQCWWKPTHWLSSAPTAVAPTGGGAIEQKVYSKQIADGRQQDSFRWKIRDCVQNC